MPYEPLHHKYRPQTFAQLVGQSAIAATLTNAINQTKIAPAYLFTGARGTGKTSSARILAKSLNCLASDRPTPTPCGVCEVCRMIAIGQAMDVIEIDAASNTGVDNIRELIDRAQFAPVQCRYKVYVIDECHMLSTSAFNALLKTLEEPPDRVVFVLATTDPQRVLSTIISRCQKFDFRRIPLPDMVSHLQTIADKEAIDITPEALSLVAQIAQGGLRDAESLLDQLSLLPNQITLAHVWDLVGAVPELDLMRLLEALAANDPETVLDQARRLMERGREPLTLLQNLASFYRDLLIAKTAPQRQDLVAITPNTWEQLCAFAQQIELPAILAAQQQLRTCELQVKNSTQPRLWLEVALLGLLPANLLSSNTVPVNTLPNTIPASPTLVRTPPASTIPSSTAPASRPPTPAPAVPPVATPTPIAKPTTPEPPVESASAEMLAAPEHPAPEADVASTENSTKTPPNLVTPSPAPLPTPVPSPASAPASTIDLNQLWQQVLAKIEFPGTRALLSQQARLLAFKGKEARVGLVTPPLLNIAMKQQSDARLEAAFEALLGHVVRVKLEVAPSPPNPDSNSGSGRRPQPTPPPNQPPTSGTAASPPPRPASPPPQRIFPQSTPATTTPPVVPSPEAPADFPLELPPPETVNPSAPKWQEIDDLTRAARSFAQFFNGVVVNLDTSDADNPDTKLPIVDLPPEIDLTEPDSGEEEMPF